MTLENSDSFDKVEEQVSIEIENLSELEDEIGVFDIEMNSYSDEFIEAIKRWLENHEETIVRGTATTFNTEDKDPELVIDELHYRGTMERHTILEFISDFEGMTDLRVEGYNQNLLYTHLWIRFD